MIMEENKLNEVLDAASEAGHILLENGAEIARVEETMQRITNYYGVNNRNFFVLSNGIFTTGSSWNDGKGSYANVEFIPLKGTQMDKIVAVNAVSREVEQGKYSLRELREKMKIIANMPAKPFWEQVIGSAFGSAGFCILFGGGLIDSLAAFATGLVVWLSVLILSRYNNSKLLINILAGSLASLVCFAFYSLGFGQNLGNMMIGALIPLIPGVPFTNGIRDIVNEDYLAGTTRLLDALTVFLGIALGVSIFFILQGHFSTGVIQLHGATPNPFTDIVLIQTIAAFVGTVGFAVLFGVPRKEYVSCGIVAALGWAVFFTTHKHIGLSAVESTFITSVLVAFASRATARMRKCPGTVFLICGLFPMIPGAGIFWTTYYITSKQLKDALECGLGAISVTLAIVLAIVVVSALPSGIFGRRSPGQARG